MHDNKTSKLITKSLLVVDNMHFSCCLCNQIVISYNHMVTQFTVFMPTYALAFGRNAQQAGRQCQQAKDWSIL